MSIGLGNTHKISRRKINEHIDTYLKAGGQITYLAINIAQNDRPAFNKHTPQYKTKK
tara:strand:+ start:894 stop:1064 length:171 start_codon:yes stop_codon:yes gene_type:complete